MEEAARGLVQPCRLRVWESCCKLRRAGARAVCQHIQAVNRSGFHVVKKYSAEYGCWGKASVLRGECSLMKAVQLC